MEHLLFIDDDADLRLLFKSVFQNTYNVCVASSVAQAKKIIQQTDFGVIVSDQSMPNETGLDFFKHLKQVNIHKPTRLLLTAYKDIDVVIEAINSGLVHKYLLKPLNAQEIKNEIKEAFQLYHSNTKKQQLRKLIDQDIEDQNEQISHELHENIAQEINAVNFYISTVASKTKEPQKEIINESKKLLSNTIKDVKKLSHLISPRVFAYQDFAENLKSLTDEDKYVTSQVSLDKILPVNKEIERSVLRTTQYILRYIRSQDHQKKELNLFVTYNLQQEFQLIFKYNKHHPQYFLEIIEEMIKPYDGILKYRTESLNSSIKVTYSLPLENEE